jgi:hypothetical protein
LFVYWKRNDPQEGRKSEYTFSLCSYQQHLFSKVQRPVLKKVQLL